MAICKYCRKSAGWFADVHDACAQKANAGIDFIVNYISDAVIGGKQYSALSAEINRVKEEAAIPADRVHDAIKEGWNKGAEERGKAQPISNSEQEAIFDFVREAGLTEQELLCRTQGAYTLLFSNLVWTVLHDQIRPYEVPNAPPPGFTRNETVPGVVGTFNPNSFNLHRGEVRVWGFANVVLKQVVTTTSFVGSYGGPGVRIANGLWYRFGEARGHKELSSSLQEMDGGELLITTRGIYFSGRGRGLNSFIPFSQIIRFSPYADAVGICRNGAREQIFAPQYLVWPDGIVSPKNCGWFLFNILQALAGRDSAQRNSFQETLRSR